MLRRTALRRIMYDLPTKGEAYGKQLDLYARRDPQLAPYMLRDVDIEYQRRCKKVHFVAWAAIFTSLFLYNLRVDSEVFYFLRPYILNLIEIRAAEDEDYERRSGAAARTLGLLSEVKKNPALWTKEHQNKIREALKAVE
eukprot:PhM_4_TR14528/c0_g1_i1/m.54045